MEKSQQAYKEILELVSKYEDLVIFNLKSLQEQSKKHLFALELKEKHGFNITPDQIGSIDYSRFGDYMALGMWGEKYRRNVSWSDDNSQPTDELLLCISFGTGAYIFGDDYPIELFKEFFEELKTYNPKYKDTVNKSLYWSLENAGILQKYKNKYRDGEKERKIAKLKKELADMSK